MTKDFQSTYLVVPLQIGGTMETPKLVMRSQTLGYEFFTILLALVTT